MGHSFIVLGDRSARFNDASLLLAHHFLKKVALRLVEESPDSKSTAAVRTYIDGWLDCGPGVITGIDLDELCQEIDGDWSPPRELLLRTRTLIESYGETIPNQLLWDEGHNTAGDHYLQDPETKFPLRVLEGMLGLIS